MAVLWRNFEQTFSESGTGTDQILEDGRSGGASLLLLIPQLLPSPRGEEMGLSSRGNSSPVFVEEYLGSLAFPERKSGLRYSGGASVNL